MILSLLLLAQVVVLNNREASYNFFKIKVSIYGAVCMIVFCEECGERYVIERDDIKEKVIMFNCRVCTDLIKVVLPEAISMNPTGGEATRN